MQFLIFLGYSFSEITILQKANPINNNSAVIRLIISKSTYHPTNKTWTFNKKTRSYRNCKEKKVISAEVLILSSFYPEESIWRVTSTAPSSWSAQTHQHESGRGRLLHLQACRSCWLHPIVLTCSLLPGWCLQVGLFLFPLGRIW